LRTCKGPKYGPVGEKKCNDCYNLTRRGPPASARTPPKATDLARSHKKHVKSEPGEPPLVALLSLQMSIIFHFATHMWRIDMPTRQSAEAAAEWVPLAQQMESDTDLWSGLNGGSQQVDLLGMGTESRVASLCQRTISIARSLLAKQHVDVGGRLHVAAMKLLRVQPGYGPQRVHYDTTKRSDAQQRFSFLLFCTQGVSTFVPVLPHAAMEPLFLKGTTMTVEQTKYAQKMCVPAHFTNFPTTPGSTMIFRTDVAHYGPKNESAAVCYAVYILLSPTSHAKDPKQDDEQRLPLGRDD